jgi:hypothetical protein
MPHRPSARILVLVIVGLLRLGAPPIAAAATDEEAARDHTKRGMAAYNLGHYDEAASEFEAAYRLFLDPALLFNIAQAHRLNGDVDKALNGYRSYLRTVPPGTRNRAAAERWSQELERVAARPHPTAAPSATATAPLPSAPPPDAPPAPAATGTASPTSTHSVATAATPASPSALTTKPPSSLALASPPAASPSLAAPTPVTSAPATTLVMPATTTRPEEARASSSNHWWIWTIAAGVAIGAGVATALVLSKNHSSPDCLGISPCGALH